MKEFGITPETEDKLREIVNVGASHAATALSDLTGKSVDISTPSVHVVDSTEGAKLLGGPDAVLAGVMAEFMGKAPCILLNVFPENIAKKILNLVKKKHGPDRATLAEVGRELCLAYCQSLKNFLQMDSVVSSPIPMTKEVDLMLEFIQNDVGEESKFILLLVEFSVGNDVQNGQFCFVFDTQSSERILKLLHEHYYGAST